MKYRWQTLSLLLAIAMVALSVSSLFNVPDPAPQAVEEVDEAQIALDNIMSRSSVRKYSNERVSEQMVETILRAGMAAPTAGNRQPWYYYVVRDTTVIRQFGSVSKYTQPMASQAQLAIVVCGAPEESFPDAPEYWVQDCSAATENILLAANAIGLGAVWCGVYPGVDRIGTLRSLLEIPENLVPLNIIMVGHPVGEPIIKDKWKSEKVFYVGK